MPKTTRAETHRARFGFFGPNESTNAKVQFIISNAGEGVGTIAQYEFGLRRRSGNINGPVTWNDGSRDLSGIPLEPGQREPAHIDSTIQTGEFVDAYMAAHEGLEFIAPTAFQIVFEGWINYDDANGLRRRSSFYREYDFKRDRFGADDDPEREYAD